MLSAMTEAELREVRVETAAASTLAFDAPGFACRPGQWIRIDPAQFPELGDALRERAERRGKPEGPGYFSTSSDGLSPGRVEITVKLSGRPGGSPLPEFLLRGLKPGRRVGIDGPGGTYGYPDPLPPGLGGVIHVCAGSGVAPNRGLIRHALGKGWPLKHLLILQDRTPEDRLFREEWGALDPGRFRLRGVFSRVGAGEYVSASLIAEAARGYLDPAGALALVCGPNEPRGNSPGFCDLAKASLREAGVLAGRILGE